MSRPLGTPYVGPAGLQAPRAYSFNEILLAKASGRATRPPPQVLILTPFAMSVITASFFLSA